LGESAPKLFYLRKCTVDAAVVGLGRRMNIEFSIAPSARTRIEWLVHELKRQIKKSDVIPVVMWIDAQLNCDVEMSGPAIGFYDNRDEIVDDIPVVGGFEFVLAIPSEYEPIFDGKELHYLNESLVLK
jgi:hypothetical protein